MENFSALTPRNGLNSGPSRGGGGGARKLVIKNLKPKPVLPENFQAKAVDKLQNAVKAIQTAQPIDASLEELYQAVEALCSHGMASEVYAQLKALIEAHVQDSLKQFTGESLDKLIFMKQMNECWSSHCRQMIMTRSIFLFLDRTYVLQNPSVLSIWELGLDTFRYGFQFIMHGRPFLYAFFSSRKSILTHQLVQTRTVDGMLMLIEQERYGDMVDRSLLKSLLRMLADLQIYKDAFEKKFLSATEKLYAAEGQRLINEMEIPQFLVHVERRLKVSFLNDNWENSISRSLVFFICFYVKK